MSQGKELEMSGRGKDGIREELQKAYISALDRI